jgi:hypothetical protein
MNPLVWRYIFEAQDPIVQFYKHDKGSSSHFQWHFWRLIHLRLSVVVSLSGPGGATLRSFDALTGQLLVERRLRTPELANPSDLGTDLAFVHDSSDIHSDVFVLTNGHTVLRLDGLSGKTKWSWTSPDQG